MKTFHFVLFFVLLLNLCQSQTPHVCTPEERENKICPLYYMQMCAWYYPEVCANIITLGGTCAKSAGNSCIACQDPKVEKVTMGACPE